MDENRFIQKTIFGVSLRPRTMVGRQGEKAVSAGRAAENTIYSIFRDRGYTIRRQVHIGETIFKTKLIADFYIDNLPMFPDGFVIESKWQSVGGSVDEKFPYLVENIMSGKYPCPVAIVLDGGGYRPEAEKWLRNRVNGQRLYAVWSIVELMTWAINNL